MRRDHRVGGRTIVAGRQGLRNGSLPTHVAIPRFGRYPRLSGCRSSRRKEIGA